MKHRDVNSLKTPLERLLWVQEMKSLNSKEFADLIGLTVPEFNNLKSRKNRVNRALTYAVELRTRVSSEWIINGGDFELIDPNMQIDSCKQAVLEMMFSTTEHISPGILRVLVFQKLEKRMLNSFDTSALLKSFKGIDSTTDVFAYFHKIATKKQKLFEDLSAIIDELYNDYNNQNCVVPLLLAIHFGKRWLEANKRSKNFHQMISLGLEEEFNDALERSLHILRKLEDLKLPSEKKGWNPNQDYDSWVLDVKNEKKL